MMPPSDKLGVLKHSGRKKKKKKKKERGEGGQARTAATASIYANMLKHPRLHFKELFTFFFPTYAAILQTSPLQGHAHFMYLFIYFMIQAAAAE